MTRTEAPQPKRARHEDGTYEADEDMSVILVYGMGYRKQTMTTRLHIVNRGEESEAVMHIDVVLAYYCAQASKDIFVRLPHEDQQEGEEHICETFKKATYSSRGAA